MKKQNNRAIRGTAILSKIKPRATYGTLNLVVVPQRILFGTKILKKGILIYGTSVSRNDVLKAHGCVKKLLTQFLYFFITP